MLFHILTPWNLMHFCYRFVRYLSIYKVLVFVDLRVFKEINLVIKKILEKLLGSILGIRQPFQSHIINESDPKLRVVEFIYSFRLI